MDNIPEYNKSLFNELLIIFWDIFQYKTDYDDFIGLSMIESYKKLFDVYIHPMNLSLILMIDKQYTSERNRIIQEGIKNG